MDPPPLPSPPAAAAPGPEPFAFPGGLPSSLLTSHPPEERVSPPLLSPTRATVDQVEETAASGALEGDGGEGDGAAVTDKVEEGNTVTTTKEQAQEDPGPPVEPSAPPSLPPVAAVDSATEKGQPSSAPTLTSSLTSYRDDPPVSSLPTLPSQPAPSSSALSLPFPPARQPQRPSSPVPDDDVQSNSSPAPTRFSPEPATLPSPTPTPTQIHYPSSSYRPTQTDVDDSPDPMRIVAADAFLPTSQTSTTTTKGNVARSRSRSVDPGIREVADPASPSRSTSSPDATVEAVGENKGFRKPKGAKVGKEHAGARGKAGLAGVEEVEETAPSSDLPALTPTQLPPPSSSLPILTQTQFDHPSVDPPSSSLPPLTQTQRAPTAKVPRKAVKPSIVESSQVSGDAAFEMEVDSPAPPVAAKAKAGKPARVFAFEVVIESSAESDSARRRSSIDSRRTSNSRERLATSSPLSPVPSSDPAPSQPKRLRRTSAPSSTATSTSPKRGRKAAPVDQASPAKKARGKKVVVERSESESERATFKQSPKKRGKKGKEVSYAESSEEEASLDESPKKKSRVGKGKGKGKAVEKRVGSKDKVVQEAKVVPAALKSTASIASSSFILSQSFSDAASLETDEDRAKGWALGRMDQLVWVRAGGEGSDFWWPGDIISPLRSARPLVIRLLLDDSEAILSFASREIKLDDPTSLNIVSFRSSAHAGRLRFNDQSFTNDSFTSPSTTLFKEILRKALELEAIRDAPSEDEDALPPPPPPRAQAARKRTPSPELSSDDELTREGNGETLTFPFNVIGKAKGRWWAGRIIGPATGPKSSGKFAIEWFDGSTESVPRQNFLVPKQKAFFTVLLGETKLDVKPGYEKDLVKFIASSRATLQAIINDEFLPAKAWNELFFAGGSDRDKLAKMSRYGELLDDHIDILRDALSDWAQGTPRPTGSPAYEALGDLVRSRYITDVLLPLAAVLLVIHEEEFDDEAREDLVDEDAVWTKSFELANTKLELGSVQKWVRAARSAKAVADANPKGMEATRRKMRAAP